jgi:hypothetical protein
MPEPISEIFGSRSMEHLRAIQAQYPESARGASRDPDQNTVDWLDGLPRQQPPHTSPDTTPTRARVMAPGTEREDSVRLSEEAARDL